MWLPDGENFFEDMFIRFDSIHEGYRRTDRQTDRQTDGQIDTAYDGIGRACIAPRGN